jgi:hypothetical protein
MMIFDWIPAFAGMTEVETQRNAEFESRFARV